MTRRINNLTPGCREKVKVPDPTVAAGYPRDLLDFAVSRGADRRMLIERSNTRPEDLTDKDNRIPLAKYIALLEAGIESCNEPALSLLFGEAVRIQDISIVGLMGGVMDSIESGRLQTNRYARLALDADNGGHAEPTELVRDNGGVWVRLTGNVYVEHPLLTESGFARCVCATRSRLASIADMPKVPFPTAIRFTHPEPTYRAEYNRIFGVPLFFESDMNALLIDEAFLTMKLPRPNPYLAEILRAHAEGLLKKLESSKSIRGRVEELLIPILHTGEASVDRIAGQLALSRQTLFRKAESGGRDLRSGVGHAAPQAGTPLLDGTEDFSQRDSLSAGLLRTGRVLALIQALDRNEPAYVCHAVVNLV